MINVILYTPEKEFEWDDFVLNASYNGTFLQTRKFLNYHKEGKFDDSSLLFYCEGELVGVCPGCVVFDGLSKTKEFSSHPGSTYGGLIISSDFLRVKKIMDLLDKFEEYLIDNEFDICTLKQTNRLLCKKNDGLLDFCFFYRGYKEYKELESYIDLGKYRDIDDIVYYFSKMKKRLKKKCEKEGMIVKQLSTHEELVRFHSILEINLKKYDLKPYHSVQDLEKLKDRFKNEIEYWGCIFDNKIVAVSMVFIFQDCKAINTHYLAADIEYNKYSPMTYVYYKMIENYFKRGMNIVSWGVTSEHLGTEINYNLTNTKEQYGSSHDFVSVFVKRLK